MLFLRKRLNTMLKKHVSQAKFQGLHYYQALYWPVYTNHVRSGMYCTSEALIEAITGTTPDPA